jgi:CheY-like chemotaxis protein/HPt (histidine-containing phosphotransfer) domain-containing protein
VLVVEDNPVNQMVAEGILESLGYAVALASNGAEGVSAFADDPDAVVAVLMDCQMPVMDGYDATRSIREMEGPGDRVPIIAMTASAVAGERERCLEAGMDDFLTKPVDVALLKATLARWTGSSSTLGGPRPTVDGVGATGHEPADVTVDVDDSGRAPDVLDEARLAELVDLDPDDPSLVLRFIDRFEANAVQTVARMREAWQAGRTDDLGRLAHSLKGTAANLGVARLAALCKDVEHRCADAVAADVSDAEDVSDGAGEGVPVDAAGIDAVEREVRTGSEALHAFAATLRPGPATDEG